MRAAPTGERPRLHVTRKLRDKDTIAVAKDRVIRAFQRPWIEGKHFEFTVLVPASEPHLPLIGPWVKSSCSLDCGCEGKHLASVDRLRTWLQNLAGNSALARGGAGGGVRVFRISHERAENEEHAGDCRANNCHTQTAERTHISINLHRLPILIQPDIRIVLALDARQKSASEAGDFGVFLHGGRKSLQRYKAHGSDRWERIGVTRVG